jgi:hypothetical protein
MKPGDYRVISNNTRGVDGALAVHKQPVDRLSNLMLFSN